MLGDRRHGGVRRLHRTRRHGCNTGKAARHEGESGQDGQPEAAHAGSIVVRRAHFVNEAPQRCDELTTRDAPLGINQSTITRPIGH